MIYFISADSINYRKQLEKRIENQPTTIESLPDLLNLARYFYETDNLEMAKTICKRARNINSNDFETLRLLAHLYFTEGMYFMTKFYCDDMGKIISNPTQAYEYLLQNALYFIYFEDPMSAWRNIESARNAFKEINPEKICDLCDSLTTKYLTEVK